MDGCENVFDQPLLYEQGWGKTNQKWIMAFNAYTAVDVTSKYVKDYGIMMKRRADFPGEKTSQSICESI
jgi:hypothetical protein